SASPPPPSGPPHPPPHLSIAPDDRAPVDDANAPLPSGPASAQRPPPSAPESRLAEPFFGVALWRSLLSPCQRGGPGL
ncbi:MAG TPA: hypothetical protein VIF09_18270, partial [Polyangiaceae bacterium]